MSDSHCRPLEPPMLLFHELLGTTRLHGTSQDVSRILKRLNKRSRLQKQLSPLCFQHFSNNNQSVLQWFKYFTFPREKFVVGVGLQFFVFVFVFQFDDIALKYI